MTKKARKTVAKKEQVASAAIEAERIRNEAIKQMQEEIRLDEYGEKRRALQEKEEAAMRETQLLKSRLVLQKHEEAYAEVQTIAEEEEKWVRYMTCDGLPDPGALADMNTFMFLWTMEEEEAGMNTVAKKCDVVTHLLDKLDEIVQFSRGLSREYVAECEQISREFRERLQWWIDIGCYRLLRKIETDMTRVDMKTARYVHASAKIVCCVWAPIALPVGLKRATEKDRKPIEVQFDEIDLTIRMPVEIDCYRMAIRGSWLTYDHYSVDASSRAIPQLPPEYLWEFTDLLDFCRQEYREKLRIREAQVEGRRLRLEEKKAMLERMEHPPPMASTERRGKQSKKARGDKPRSAKKKKTEVEQESPTLVGSVPHPGTDQQLPYLPTPDEIIRAREEETRKELRKLLSHRCEKTEINLRKYKILGGVFRLDLIYQPPQPKDTGNEMLLTTLQLPKEAQFVPFSKTYEPPPPAPDSERTPEVIEAEMKALEAAMEELALVTLKLPSSVLWFEPPLVAHWIPEKQIWSTRDVHDMKYNEEKQTIAFRTGRLGVHGLAAYKFVNLPFQSWELKPETGRNARGGVVLSVTAATVQAEFVAREDRVCLNSLAGGTSTALKGIIGEYMKLHSLIERMREAGCDLFPEKDACIYLKGLSMKHAVTERHLRFCMALLCTAYSFAWSRWNAARDYREIVVQFKELHGCVAKERTNLTILVTPLRTVLVRCTEVSPEFSSLPPDEEDPKFYADLYNLAFHRAGIKSRLLMSRISFKLVSTVAQLLERTNVISMSS